MGSVAYKLALVSAGLADITFTLTPKNEWDVVAGAALVLSAGGFVSTLEKTSLTANRRESSSVGPAGQRTFPEGRVACSGRPAHLCGRNSAPATSLASVKMILAGEN